MLKNKWVITKKFPDKSASGMSWYRIVPVDTWQDIESETYSNQILSKRNYDIGAYTDDELNPFAEEYRNKETDIATVEMTNNSTPDADMIQISLFGRRFGEFTILMEKQEVPVNMTRGNTVLVRRKYIDFDKECFVTKIIYNLTTRRKAKHFPKSKHKFGDCDIAVITGIDSIDPLVNTDKHLLAYSEKFGYVSFIVAEDEPEFPTRMNDKVLIERYLNRNTDDISYRILSNTNIDNMRHEFLVKQR